MANRSNDDGFSAKTFLSHFRHANCMIGNMRPGRAGQARRPCAAHTLMPSVLRVCVLRKCVCFNASQCALSRVFALIANTLGVLADGTTRVGLCNIESPDGDPARASSIKSLTHRLTYLARSFSLLFCSQVTNHQDQHPN